MARSVRSCPAICRSRLPPPDPKAGAFKSGDPRLGGSIAPHSKQHRVVAGEARRNRLEIGDFPGQAAAGHSVSSSSGQGHKMLTPIWYETSRGGLGDRHPCFRGDRRNCSPYCRRIAAAGLNRMPTPPRSSTAAATSARCGSTAVSSTPEPSSSQSAANGKVDSMMAFPLRGFLFADSAPRASMAVHAIPGPGGSSCLVILKVRR